MSRDMALIPTTPHGRARCLALHSTGVQCHLPDRHKADAGLSLHQNGPIRWGSDRDPSVTVGPVHPMDVDHGIPTRACDEGTCDCTGPAEPACINPYHGDMVSHGNEMPGCYANEDTIETAKFEGPRAGENGCDCTMRSDHTLTCASRKRAYVTRKMYHPRDVLVATDQDGNVVGYLIEEVEVR